MSIVREEDRAIVMLPRVSLAGAIGISVTVLVVIAAVFAPVLAPYPPSRLVGMPFEAPGEFLLGTDVVGRDLLSRLLYGARFTLLVTFAATTLGFLAGAAWGFAVSRSAAAGF